MLDVKLKKDEDFVVDKFCVSTWDGLPEYKYDEFDFDALKAKNEDWWKKKLATCKVKITGEEGLQLAFINLSYTLRVSTGRPFPPADYQGRRTKARCFGIRRCLCSRFISQPTSRLQKDS